jgi:hypothetical protein
MPTAPLIRYPLDATGTNADNAVSGEVKSLSVAQIRAVAPTFAPFFTESLIVYDHGNNRLLVRGVDYQCVELLQEATLRFGKEIAQLILVINPAVTSQVRLTYQVLGGLYQNNAEGLVNMYETVITDGRTVDWSNVFNKPTTYTPTLHRHLLEDLYGFESVVVALERVRNAIVLSDVPAFEALIDWVKSRAITSAEIDNGQGLDKFVTHQALLEMMQSRNFNSFTIDPPVEEMEIGQTEVFWVRATSLPTSAVLYWTIEHRGTSAADFTTTSGVLNMNRNRGSFSLTILNNVERARNTFDIAIRKGSPTGPIVAKVADIALYWPAVASRGANSTMALLTACCVFEPSIKVNAKSLFLVGDR